MAGRQWDQRTTPCEHSTASYRSRSRSSSVASARASAASAVEHAANLCSPSTCFKMASSYAALYFFSSSA